MLVKTVRCIASDKQKKLLLQTLENNSVLCSDLVHFHINCILPYSFIPFLYVLSMANYSVW